MGHDRREWRMEYSINTLTHSTPPVGRRDNVI